MDYSAGPQVRFSKLFSDLKAPLFPGLLFFVTRLAAVVDLAFSDATLQQLLVLDSARYETAARRIAAGEFAGGSGSFSFAPLYAYYLALIHTLGGDLPTVYASQIAVSGFGVWLLFRIGDAIFGRSRAVLSSSLWCLYGAAGMMELKVTEATLATTLTLWGVFLLLPARGSKLSRFLLAGSVLGLACLARPNTLLIYPPLAVWLASGGSWPLRSHVVHHRLGRVAAFALGAGLAITPVTLRNHLSSGGWTLISSQGGVTFSQGNNSAANGSYAALDGFSGDPAAQAGEAERLASAAEGRALTEAEVDYYWYKRGWSFLTAHPWNALLLWLKKLACWLGSDELSMEYVLGAERVVHPSLALNFAALGCCSASTNRRYNINVTCQVQAGATLNAG
ncbi:MAG: glycosyltransferase family 39 protein, partial [Polyangiaceae bacterium]